MLRNTLITLLALAATVLHVGFFSAFQGGLGAVHLPLIMIIWLISTFRFSEAFITATATGLTLDLLIDQTYSAQTVVLIGLTTGLIAMFTHLFTNNSLPAFIGIHTTAFVALAILTHAVRFAHEGIFGTPGTISALTTIGLLLSGLAWQLGIAAGINVLLHTGRRMSGMRPAHR